MRVCVCVFSSHSFWTSSSLDVPAGVTQEGGQTGFLIHLLSAVRALIFLATRIQPFLSLVDREVEFYVLTISTLSTRWAFLFSNFCFSVRKIPFAGIELTSQRVRGYMVPLSYRGDRQWGDCFMSRTIYTAINLLAETRLSLYKYCGDLIDR